MSAANAAVLFDGARLTLARQLAGLRKSDLASALQKSPTAIAGWENGSKRPSRATVAELAMRLGVDAAFFAVSEHLPTPTSAPHFRSLRATTQLEREQATAYGQLAAAVAGGLEKHVEYPAIAIPKLPVDIEGGDATPEEAAQLVRHEWSLGDGPIGHLVRLVENHGVLVVFSPCQAAAVDAYSFDSRERPVVVLNPLKRDYYRQRFDLAHELGHLVMHEDAEPGGRTVEEQAHRFASEFLAPAEQIRPLLPTSMNAAAWVTLARLKEQWGVSMQALLLRARRLGLLSDVSYRNAMMTISARGWRRSEPGQTQTVEQPSLLPRAVELLDGEGIDETVLAAECRAPLNLFRATTSRTPGRLPNAADNEPPPADRRKVMSLLGLPG